MLTKCEIKSTVNYNTSGVGAYDSNVHRPKLVSKLTNFAICNIIYNYTFTFYHIVKLVMFLQQLRN